MFKKWSGGVCGQKGSIMLFLPRHFVINFNGLKQRFRAFRNQRNT